MVLSGYSPLSVLCVFVCLFVCDINQSTTKKPHYVSDLSKLDALLHTSRSCTKVQRLDMCRSILLSKIASQMWRDHPFSQRDRKSSGSGAGDDRKVGGWGRWADEKRG